MVERGTKRKNPHIKRQQRISRLKSPAKREKKPKTPKEAIRIHYSVIRWLILQQAQKKGKKDKIGIDDIGIFEFIFHGLPEPPELEGICHGLKIRVFYFFIFLKHCK